MDRNIHTSVGLALILAIGSVCASAVMAVSAQAAIARFERQEPAINVAAPVYRIGTGRVRLSPRQFRSTLHQGNSTAQPPHYPRARSRGAL